MCPHPECCMRIVGDEMPDVCKLMQTVIEASPLAEEARSAAAAREEAATRGEKPHRYTFDPRIATHRRTRSRRLFTDPRTRRRKK